MLYADELSSLARWFEQEVVSKNIPQKCSNLANVVKTNVANDGNKQSYTPVAKDLKDLLHNVNTASLSNEQRSFLDQLGVGSLLGPVGKEHLAQVVAQSDIPNMAIQTQEIAALIEKTVVKLKTLRTSLDECGIKPMDLVDPAGRCLIRVTFKDGLTITNAKTLVDFTAEWRDIVYDLTRSLGGFQEDLEFKGASNGSFIAVFYGHLDLGLTILHMMEEAAKMGLAAIEVAEMIEKFKRWKSVSAVKKEAEEQESVLIDEAVSKVISHSKVTDHERQNFLRAGAKKFFAFVRRGGDVECVPPAITKETSSEDKINIDHIAATRLSIAHVREEVRLLTHEKTE